MNITRRSVLAGALVSAHGVALAGLPQFSRPYRIDTLSFGAATDLASLEALRKASMDAVVIDLMRHPRTFETALAELHAINALEARADAPIRIIRRAGDFERARLEQRLGVVLASLDASILGHGMTDYVAALEQLYSQGLRVLQLTHNFRTAFGEGFMEPHDGGLSLAGRQLVAAMNRRGMIIDLSHCSTRTILEAAAASVAPVMATHTGIRALAPTLRNMADEAIDAIAATGGMVSVFGLTTWLTDQEQVTADHVLAHFHYLAARIGIERVGFGSDGELAGTNAQDETARMGRVQVANAGGPSAEWPVRHTRLPALNTPDRMPSLASLLAKQGFTAAQIDGVCGENFKRLFLTICG